MLPANPIDRLRELAKENFVTSDHKLMQLARRKGIPVSAGLVKQALAKDVGKQLFAPAPRSIGQSAAEAPGSRLQADLVDFSKNTGSKGYAELLVDVYTRKVYAQPLQTKDAQSVLAATKHILETVPGHGVGATLSTDQGGEFAKLDDIDGVIHRTKVNGEINSISVVDRRMQDLKRMLGKDAGQTNQKFYDWQSKLASAVHALNDNPSSAVHGAPDDVGKDNIQSFMVMQDNANKFAHNQALTEKRKAALEAAGAYRPPIADGGRSFKPRYGAVHEVARIEPGARFVTDTQGRQNLLQLAKPVPKGSGEATGSLTLQTKYAPRPIALERSSASRPMTKQIPLAAGTPIEGPRHHIRIKTGRARQEAASSGSGWVGPRPPVIEVVPAQPAPKLHPITQQIQTYQSKTTKEERAAKAAIKAAALKQATEVALAKKQAKLQILTEKEIAKQAKMVAKAFKKT